MFVKVCGLKTAAAVEAAVTAGADAIGFVFARSPREIAPGLARALAQEIPDSVLTVGVFRGVPPQRAAEVAAEAGVRAVQLHGDYPPEAFTHFPNHRLIRATALSADTDIKVGAYGEHMLLLDSAIPGSGERWDLTDTPLPTGDWLLAGGLTPSNVATAIAEAHPWGVDVSSGVEARRGEKDPAMIKDFVAAAKA
ncbi:phosphoribosylanthranilate isomerase [Actinokineospora sp. NPDC004072]